MAACTGFTVVHTSWVCQARYYQEGSVLRGNVATPHSAYRPNGYMGTRLVQQKNISNAFKAPALRILSVVASSDFAAKEASKFREDLAEELGKDESVADAKGRIVDICAKVFQNYVSTYSGTLTPQPFENMKTALQDQGLPTDKALRCAIWWVRANLNRDWEQWTTVNR